MPTAIADTAKLHNDVEMPYLGLGTWKTPDGDEVVRSVKWALEAGYRHIDTAAIYGNEEGVGRGIRESGVARQQIFLTTKLWNEDQAKGYDACLQAFEASLERLGTDYVDLYLIHWPGGRSREAWRALETIYEEGRAKAIGVSNFMVTHLEDLLGSAKVVPMVDQVEFHPHLVQPDLLAFCKENGIQHEAWSPLMQGEIFDIPVMKEIAEKHGKSVAQVVLRWDLQHGVVTIPKSVHEKRIRANADLFDFELSEEEMRRIDALDQGRRIGPDPYTFNF